MIRNLLLVAALAAGLTLSACGAEQTMPVSASDTGDQVGAVRSVLSDAGDAAERFGQAHLGHYLKMDTKALRREGLEVPSGISLAVKTDHTSYCVLSTASELPSIHPWAKASLSSSDLAPAAEDRCGK
jgi:hypothetical protein